MRYGSNRRPDAPDSRNRCREGTVGLVSCLYRSCGSPTEWSAEMTSTKPTILALLALGLIGASGALAQTATSEPSEKPMMQNQGGAMMQNQDMQRQGMQRGRMQGDMRGLMGRGGRMGPDMMVMMMIMVDTNGDG